MRFVDLVLLGMVSLFSLACGSGGSEKVQNDCKYGVPKALFSESMDLVTEHQFLLNDREANESAIFKNGTKLELIQSGCEKAKQTFQMTLVGDFSEQPDPFWINMAADMFAYFAKCDDSLQAFLFWQEAIKREALNIRLAQKRELEPRKVVKIDRILGNQNAILLVELGTE